MKLQSEDLDDDIHKSPKPDQGNESDRMELETFSPLILNDAPISSTKEHTEYIFERLLNPNVFREEDPIQSMKDDNLVEEFVHTENDIIFGVGIDALSRSMSTPRDCSSFNSLHRISRQLMSPAEKHQDHSVKPVIELFGHDVEIVSTSNSLRSSGDDLKFLDEPAIDHLDSSGEGESDLSEPNAPIELNGNGSPTDSAQLDSRNVVEDSDIMISKNQQEERSEDITTTMRKHSHHDLTEPMSESKRRIDIGCGFSCLKERVIVAKNRTTRRKQHAVDRQCSEFSEYFRKRKSQLKPKDKNIERFIIRHDKDGLCEAERCDVLALILD